MNANAQQISNSALSAIARELEPTCTMDDYANSVVELYKLAQHGSSSGCTAAQLLLSGYNGNNWQLDITDLCSLDRSNLKLALTYLECRARLWTEPHELLKNGNELFPELAKQWRKLHIDNRWKSQCRECYGSGEIYVYPDDENDDSTKTCPDCNGLGLVANVREF
ncbi:hypothetical protein [Endozoicomonas sp. SESOKO4]|uniref:DUF7673 family protein n=1 Tax=Endozoicomonas sp. SESOKO4 TaxID=2828745 RepID=UPI002149944F|nr:hypothetical protein [Endozoicomonas sp. SESOKO4]